MLFRSAGQVYAVAISPGSGLEEAKGNQKGVPKIEKELKDGWDIELDLQHDFLYKHDHDDNKEYGDLKESFFTSYTNDDEGEADGGTIGRSDGLDLSGYRFDYLFVKGGGGEYSWYLFDISDWDTVEDLVLTNFWPTQGSISHVALYGQPVPLPASVFLLGAGCAALAGARVKRRGRRSV